MRTRLMVILAVAVVAGLIPVAAAAKPKPPEPSWPNCEFEDGVLQGYAGGNYNCIWQAGAGTNWDITVTPERAAVSITLAVKDNQTSAGGDLCPVGSTVPEADRNAAWKPEWSRGTDAVTATYALPSDGECVDPYSGSVETGNPNEFTLFVDTAPGRNRVSVTVDQLP